MLPAVDFDGKIMMETNSSLSLSPNGNGALFDALSKDGALLRTFVKELDYV